MCITWLVAPMKTVKSTEHNPSDTASFVGPIETLEYENCQPSNDHTDQQIS